MDVINRAKISELSAQMALLSGADPEVITAAVNGYLVAHPISGGSVYVGNDEPADTSAVIWIKPYGTFFSITNTLANVTSNNASRYSGHVQIYNCGIFHMNNSPSRCCQGA